MRWAPAWREHGSNKVFLNIEAIKSMHVVCLAKRWQRHTASGGYDRLARETGATVFQRIEGSGFLHRVLGRLWRIRSRTNVQLMDYRYEDFLAEWRLLARSWFRKPDLVHVLHGNKALPTSGRTAGSGG